jgi:hypothetical protein
MGPMRRGRAHAWPPARAALLAALAGSLAACGSSESTAPAASSSPAVTRAASTASAATASFVSIVEPFDPGHPARTESAPASCGGQPTTIATEHCYQTKDENIDAQIDVAQFARYSAASARLDAIRGIIPPEARLKGTDSTDPNRLSWYTTPEGSRIAEIDTQGDQTGGAVVAWVIVGGAQGFVVNPRQFYFQDGSFTDPGVPEPSTPSYYRVPAGKEFQFSIDYSKLAKDPNAGSSGAGYLYAPGSPVAVWS